MAQKMLISFTKPELKLMIEILKNFQAICVESETVMTEKEEKLLKRLEKIQYSNTSKKKK